MAPRILFDFPDRAGSSRRRAFAPGTVIHATHPSEVLSALDEIVSATQAGATAVGFISYEAASAFDAAFETHPPGHTPLVWFALVDEVDVPTVADHTDSAVDQDNELGAWQLELSASEHAAAVARIREEIAAGTTYQVNLTARMHAPFTGEPLALYESLRHARGAGYHALIETDEWAVLSLSPELFFETRGGAIRSKPMKGTRARGRFAEEDELLARDLKSSAKERAENLMIVDLMRNDIGRVAKTGSVEVPSLYDVERYPTVHQLTSTVTARLRDDVQLPHILTALFPAGSVTGAPKISTMKLIRELEPSPRGVYCGAIGIIEPEHTVFNVPIRTMWIDRVRRRAEYGSGGGITTDSDEGAEYQELLTKALVVSQPWPQFELLETMRAEAGRIVRLDRHLGRMERSAAYFGYAFDSARMHVLLDQGVRDHSGRVRLLLGQDGHARVELDAFDTVAEPLVRLAATPVSSRNRFLFHKTTQRREYELHHEEAPGAFDVLLWNERGEITEFTRGNVVFELAGERVTPLRECGLLAGVFREELLHTGVLAERVIRKADIDRASRIWFINSLREWVEVRLD